MTDSQRAYEQKRAAKAGMTLERWLESKERKQTPTVAAKPAATRKPNLFSRLIERAQRPLGKQPGPK